MLRQSFKWEEPDYLENYYLKSAIVQMIVQAVYELKTFNTEPED